jgi:membrane protease YdiL (CAAX protease family)
VSLFDAMLLPDGVPGAAEARGRRRGGWGPRVGAVLLWGTAQGIFLLPRRMTPYVPLIPPAVGILVNLAVAAAFLWWYVWRSIARGDRRRLATFRVRPAGAAWRWVPIVVAGIMGLMPSGLIVSARLLVPPPERETIIERYGRAPAGALALLVTVAVVAPLLEEFLFRGWMQRTLERRFARAGAGRALGRRRAAWRAIALTSAVFAAVHFESFGFPLRLTLAVASGYAAWTTRSIWPSVVMHGSYNGWAMLVGLLLPVDSARDLVRLAARPAVLWPSALALVGSALVLVWGLRAMAAARARPEPEPQAALRATDAVGT